MKEGKREKLSIFKAFSKRKLFHKISLIISARVSYKFLLCHLSFFSNLWLQHILALTAVPYLFLLRCHWPDKHGRCLQYSYNSLTWGQSLLLGGWSKEGTMDFHVYPTGWVSQYILKRVSIWRLLGELQEVTLWEDPALIWVRKFLLYVFKIKLLSLLRSFLMFRLSPTGRWGKGRPSC